VAITDVARIAPFPDGDHCLGLFDGVDDRLAMGWRRRCVGCSNQKASGSSQCKCKSSHVLLPGDVPTVKSWEFVAITAHVRQPLVSFQINRQLSGWILPPQVFRAFGAHGQEETSQRGDITPSRARVNNVVSMQSCQRDVPKVLLFQGSVGVDGRRSPENCINSIFHWGSSVPQIVHA
jgi:hypothetical protein